MKTDPLKQFVALRGQLEREKESLERRLAEINAALGALPVAADAAAAQKPHRIAPVTPGRAGPAPRAPRPRGPASGVSLRDAVLAAVRSKPLTRHEILKAVVARGYRFRAKNPLNSLSAFLYMDKSVKNVGGRFSPA